jgi:hypothetical protein
MTDGGISVSSQIGDPSGHKEFWQLHIQLWHDSGLSQRAYCKKNSLSEFRFSKWKSRLVNDNDAGRFVRVPLPAHLPAPIKGGVLHVHCPNGFRVDINEEFDSDLLKKLLTVLGEVSHAL